MSLCPTMDRCSTLPPRLLPLPRCFLPYFENRDQSMERELFRRMMVKWIREAGARSKSSGGDARRCCSDPSPFD
jgi:hypothetical protein